MDDPKQVIKRFVGELWNERRLDVADAIFADALNRRCMSFTSLFGKRVLQGLQRREIHADEAAL